MRRVCEGRSLATLRKGGLMTASEMKRKFRNFPEAELRRRITAAPSAS